MVARIVFEVWEPVVHLDDQGVECVAELPRLFAFPPVPEVGVVLVAFSTIRFLTLFCS